MSQDNTDSPITISLAQEKAKELNSYSLTLTYIPWLEFIESNKDDYYYENLVRFSKIITNDLKEYKQHFIARKLRMSGPKLSNIKPLLEAIANKEKK